MYRSTKKEEIKKLRDRSIILIGFQVDLEEMR